MAGPGGMRPRGMKSEVENPMQIFRRLMGYVMRRYRFRLILVVTLIIIGVLANVQGTLFTRTLIDDYIAPMLKSDAPDFAPLARAIGRVACFYAIGVAATYLYQKMMIYVTQGTMRDLRNDLFSHMERLPVRYFDTHAHGDVMSIYTNDIDALRQMISMSVPQLANSGFTVVTVLISMLILSVPMTFVTLGMIGVMLLVTAKVGSLSGKYFVSQQRDLGTLNGYIEEMMHGQKVIKVFNHEDEVTKEFLKRNDALFASADKANRFSNIIGPINLQLSNLNYVVCAIIGGVLALNHIAGLTVGIIASMLTFNRSLSMPINQISMQLNSIIMAIAGADRVFKLMDEAPEADDGDVTLVNVKQEGDELVECEEKTGRWAWKMPERTDAMIHTATGEHVAARPGQLVELRGDLVMDQVDFGYVPEKMVLHDVSLYAKPGQKIAFVGSTGAGKTTITNLINRFYDIQDGKIRYDGINVNRIRKADLRRSLGMVLQETNLFTGTVMENIRFGRLDATDEEVVAAAKLANAHAFIERLPQGYETVLHGNGGSLSHGQRQLLAIARAAVADPPALILDEATSSIDTRTERIVQEGMDKLMEGRTTFVIAHRLSTVRNANCIMVLEAGRIIERGTHEELIEQKGKYYQLYTGGSPAA